MSPDYPDESLREALLEIGIPAAEHHRDTLRAKLEETLLCPFDPSLPANDYAQRLLKLSVAGLLFIPKGNRVIERP